MVVTAEEDGRLLFDQPSCHNCICAKSQKKRSAHCFKNTNNWLLSEKHVSIVGKSTFRQMSSNDWGTPSRAGSQRSLSRRSVSGFHQHRKQFKDEMLISR